jgi:hypothetical protein
MVIVPPIGRLLALIATLSAIPLTLVLNAITAIIPVINSRTIPVSKIIPL